MAECSVTEFLGFSGRDIADGLEKPLIAKPVGLFESGEPNRLEGAPWSTPVNDFSLVKAVDGFGQSVSAGVNLQRFAWVKQGFQPHRRTGS